MTIKRLKTLLRENRLFAIFFRTAKILVITGGAILFLQDFMLFHPNHDPQSWAYLTAREEFEAVEFTSNESGRNGILRRGAAGNGDAPLILFFYGNAMNAAGTMLAMERFNIWHYFHDFHVLIVDYAGYGPGRRRRPSARIMHADALAAFDFAQTLPGVSKVIVGSYSIGTGPAVYLASSRPISGLFLLAPFANVYDLFNNVLPIFHGPARALVRHKFLPDSRAQAVSVPALLVASRSDEVIPFASSQRLNASFGGETKFVALEGARHNEVLFNLKALESVRSYLQALQNDW